jgi:RNA polymerase sigma factor for flagellar operon FliA
LRERAAVEKRQDAGDLLKKYRESRDVNLRNELVLRYSYIAQTVGNQMRGIASNYADLEDIVNQGMLTLIDCIEKFDPEKEVRFESYAFMRIRGAIIDFIRKQDWRPRRVRKTAKEVTAARDELSNILMREPTDRELSDFLNITEDELAKHYSELSRAMIISFESMLENTLQSESLLAQANDAAKPEQTLFVNELRDQLAKAIDDLPERERTVISLYYYENLKLAEISKVLGVSESRVCQIHSKALGRLKEKMDQYMKG